MFCLDITTSHVNLFYITFFSLYTEFIAFRKGGCVSFISCIILYAVRSWHLYISFVPLRELTSFFGGTCLTFALEILSSSSRSSYPLEVQTPFLKPTILSSIEVQTSSSRWILTCVFEVLAPSSRHLFLWGPDSLLEVSLPLMSELPPRGAFICEVPTPS